MIKKLFWLIVIVVLGSAFLVLGISNSEDVHFNYVLGERQMPLMLIMAISFLFGAALAMMLFGFSAMFWRARARKLQTQINATNTYQRNQAIKSRFEAEQKA